jgi:isoleucyl-tRNA synthetase
VYFRCAVHGTESSALIREDLQRRGVLFSWGDYVHRYPMCWRCKTPLVFRLVDEWFISCAEVREAMKRARCGGCPSMAAV